MTFQQVLEQLKTLNRTNIIYYYYQETEGNGLFIEKNGEPIYLLREDNFLPYDIELIGMDDFIYHCDF